MKNAPQKKTWQSYGNYGINAFPYCETIRLLTGIYMTFDNYFYFLVYTEGFSFQELPWSQRQAIFFESSQIGEYFIYLSAKNRDITVRD